MKIFLIKFDGAKNPLAHLIRGLKIQNIVFHLTLLMTDISHLKKMQVRAPGGKRSYRGGPETGHEQVIDSRREVLTN